MTWRVGARGSNQAGVSRSKSNTSERNFSVKLWTKLRGRKRNGTQMIRSWIGVVGAARRRKRKENATVPPQNQGQSPERETDPRNGKRKRNLAREATVQPRTGERRTDPGLRKERSVPDQNPRRSIKRNVID